MTKPFFSAIFTRCLLIATFTLAASSITAVQLAHADIRVLDDIGQPVKLTAPAQRIISLAPHITEMLFSAGAGERIVGTVSYSDYPPAAKEIPQVGSFKQFDFERIASLKPDLIVGWKSGNPAGGLEQLRDLGFTVYVTEPREIEGIATNIERLAELAGSENAARAPVKEFREGISSLRENYEKVAPVSLFYEVWNDPLMTLNGEHLFSDVARLCGGRNVFADLPALAPRIDIEAVLAKNPEVIIASGMHEERPDWLDDWKQWPSLRAVKNDHLYFIPPDIIQRHTLRILEGAQQLCTHLDKAR